VPRAVLTYGGPTSLLLRREQDSIRDDVDRLLRVVATQSLPPAAAGRSRLCRGFLFTLWAFGAWWTLLAAAEFAS
jgi:hypothetical protein